MERENKYLVIKHDDIEKYLNHDDQVRLARICRDIELARAEEGKGRTQYVCVAHDWPMYDATWQAIENWVDSLGPPADKE